MSFSEVASPIEDIIEDAKQGRMFILVDDEDRENEGDLVIPASKASPEAVNFMARYGRGLICLALERSRVEELKLALMPQHNASRLQTAFTVSIEARDGVTTGISAADRARTISVAIDPTKNAHDLVTPGHVFPLMARDGGVLVRTGHTEAAVDISKLAGLPPAGVICEIMNDDGSMARRPELIAFAQLHGLKIATIADLIAYRRRTEKLVKRTLEAEIDSAYGGHFKLMTYVDTILGDEHMVLVKGDITTSEPVLVRVQIFDALTDLYNCQRTRRSVSTQDAMKLLGEEGRGVLVLLIGRQAENISDQLRGRLEEPPGTPPVLRDYGLGAQILRDLGIQEMILLTNVHRAIIALEGYGLKVVGHRPIPLWKSGQ